MAVGKGLKNRILVINPNSNVSITRTLEPLFSDMNLSNTTLSYWTCPVGPSMIQSQADMYESTSYCLPLLLKVAGEFDGFLAACYADHPLVRLLQSYVGIKPVVGLFDASIVTALHLVRPGSKFGIVTTGVAYETLLAESIKMLLGSDDRLYRTFGGVTASGVSLTDLDPGSQAKARDKVMAATKRLIQINNGDLDVVSLGGVILAGMEAWVHSACVAELGEEAGSKIKVIDQLHAGMLSLTALLENKRLHPVDYNCATK